MCGEETDYLGDGGDFEGCAEAEEEVAGVDVALRRSAGGRARDAEEGVVEFFGELFAEEGYIGLHTWSEYTSIHTGK